MSRLRPLFAVLAGLALLACGGEPEREPHAAEGPAAPAPAHDAAAAGDAPPGPWFADVTAETGLDFVHRSGRAGDYHMAEILGAGVGLLDYDRDGDLDLYLVQSGPLPGAEAPAGARRDRLYRNLLREEGALGFTDVTAASGLAADGYGMGVNVADVDGDGWPDLYVSNLGPNELWRNRGDGTFEDWTAAAGVGDPSWSVVGVFFDADGDGDLDLWVGNYVDYPESDPPQCRDFAGARDYCGPDSVSPAADRFYRREGERFHDASAELGLAARAAPTLGAVAADVDDDGRVDLYLANDGRPNQLWLQRPEGLVEEGMLSGAALNAAGQAEGSMGVVYADLDDDGKGDLFLTHLETETNTLYRGGTDGLFVDASVESGLGPPSVVATAFGTDGLDVDNDGRLDLAVANGAIKRLPALARAGEAWPYHQPNQLFRGVGAGRFVDASAAAGDPFQRSEVSRGLVAGDLDEDGDEDLVVTQNDGPARILENLVGQDAPSLRVLPIDGAAPALGARVALVAADGTVGPWRWLVAGGSYLSSRDPRLHFGLGGGSGGRWLRAPAPRGILVVWPDGSRETFDAPATGRAATALTTLLVRGAGRPSPPS